MTEYRYRAFISYSHADERWARWLHRRLETYRVPAHLVGTAGARGPVPARIGRCFRDRAELSAASELGETLQQALRDSQSLIIVCSPQAAASRWVNEEIRYFRALGRGDRIYALIVAGTPNAPTATDECFPRALLVDDSGAVLREPLAADARSGQEGEGDAFLRLVAGLLGIGFDALRRREQRRRQRMMVAAIAGSLAVAVLTTTLAISAYQARNEARKRKAEAEDLVTFMLGDLKDRLEKLGRLDVLDSTVGKAASYLRIDEQAFDAGTLGHRSEALAAVADIRYAQGDLKDAIENARLAVAAARELHQRQPDDYSKQRLAAALYALGEPSLEEGAFEATLPQTLEGLELARQLHAAAPDDAERRLLLARFDDQRSYILTYGPQADVEQAQAGLNHCIEILRPVVASSTADSRYWRFLLRCEVQRALVLQHADRDAEAIAAYELFMTDADTARPRVANDRATLLILQFGYANATLELSGNNRLADAERASGQSMAIGQRLVMFEPDNMEWLRQLAIATRGDALLKARQMKPEAARIRAEEALAMYAKLLERNPDSSNIRRDALAAKRLYAALQMEHFRNRDAALARLASGLALLRSSDEDSKLRLAGLGAYLQQALYAAEADPALAAASQRAARELLEKLEKVEGTVSAEQLAFSRAALAYLEGRLQEGDAQYAAVRGTQASGIDLNGSDIDAYRTLACDRLRKQGASCPPIKTPPVV